MSSGFAWLAALALVCVALGLLLWQRGMHSQGRASAARFIDSRIARGMGVEPGMAPARMGSPASAMGAASGHSMQPSLRASAIGAGMGTPAAGTAARAASASVRQGADAQHAGTGVRAQLRVALENIEARAGLAGLRVPVFAFLGASVLLCLWAVHYAGVLAACAGGLVCVAIGALIVAARSQRRRLTVVRQLPTFLDAIVRLVTLGNSVPAAFQAALQNTESPLRECLDQVSRSLRAGVEIDRALGHVGEIYRTREFEFVGAVLRLSVKYGGRADVMLDRMSVFMRDLEQAERELTSMSAETRLSAWVLVALPLILGGYLIFTNPMYFHTMWIDPVGRKMVYVAFGLQIFGSFLLYQMTRLRS